MKTKVITSKRVEKLIANKIEKELHRMDGILDITRRDGYDYSLIVLGCGPFFSNPMIQFVQEIVEVYRKKYPLCVYYGFSTKKEWSRELREEVSRPAMEVFVSRKER